VSDVVVDATGLRCPLPVSRLAAALAEVPIGTVISLLATDPASQVDVPVWCRLHRHRLTSVEAHDGGWCFRVIRTQ
jgi:tRNA 2-thiouridine synthesizing protein A